ncbi:CxC2 domain-containing protein [Mycena kentingensis (nom. inval.)]|nr:CxC2 domain-containing protein [Mycena kentingensis (nom. inval.)]
MSFRQQKRQRASGKSALDESPYTYAVPVGGAIVDAPVDAAAARVSSDSRRTYSEAIHVDPPSPLKRVRLGYTSSSRRTEASTEAVDEEYRLGDGWDDWFEGNPQNPEPDTTVPRTLRPADAAMEDWRQNQRDRYLRIMLWTHGRGTAPVVCPRCSNSQVPALHRCSECFDDRLYCATCCVEVHKTNPLHRIEVWTGVYFAKTSLKELGLRVQLGHGHEDCDRPHHTNDFVVVHENGIHNVAVAFCGCHETTDPHHIQLLRRGWYPSTTGSPRTAVTITCLNRFDALSLKAKITPYDFYGALEVLTDSTGVKPPDRYKIFLRVAAPIPGVHGTGPGELAIRCPACPRPGVNLPEGWENASAGEKGLYILFLALDACFRLKRRNISNEFRDPGLGTGLAYMVEWLAYRMYLQTVPKQREMSGCSGLAAVDLANTKYSRGYHATGVGMAICARHEFVQPTGVADLQAGERYANMDWIFLCVLRWLHHRLPKMVSYDIVCHWWIKAMERFTKLLKKYPFMFRLQLILALFRAVVPKLHIKGHNRQCQREFSLNLVPGSGQTDGEGIERSWSTIGGVAASSRVCGPGARWDMLDSHWAFANWCKMVHLASLLRRRLDNALEQHTIQETAFKLFTEEQKEKVPAWMKMVLEFEEDGTKPNPYEESSTDGLTEAQVREEFEKEEAAEAASGIPPIHDISPSTFLVELLAIESEQRRILAQVELKKAKSTAMSFNIRRLRRQLNKRMDRARALQGTYMPAALQVLAARDIPADTLVERVPILLPSDLSPAERSNGGCRDGLVDIERALREAQCRAARRSLCHQLIIKQRLFAYKNKHSRAQGMNTRSRTLITRNEVKVLSHSRKYQAAWRALVALSESGEAGVRWRKLEKGDIRCWEDVDDLAAKTAKAEREEKRRRREEADLRAAGIAPLIVRRGDDSDDSNGDGSDTELTAAASGSTSGRPALGRYEREDGFLRSGESRRTVSWIWTVADGMDTDAESQEILRIEWCKAWARTRRWAEEVRLLKEEFRRVPLSFGYEEKCWIERARMVPVGEIDTAEAEGMLAYATKQADIFRTLALRTEVTRTEPKLKRGCRRSAPITLITTVLDGEEGEGDGEIEPELDDEGGWDTDEEEFFGDDTQAG